MGVAGAVALAGPASAAPKSKAGDDYVLRNVRLETGYDRDADGVSATRTGLFNVRITGGKIATIGPAGPSMLWFSTRRPPCSGRRGRSRSRRSR